MGWVVIGAVVVGCIFLMWREHKKGLANQQLLEGTEKPSILRDLPLVFYVVGWLCAGGAIIFFNVEASEPFIYCFGSMLVCIGGGRVIKLLQNIDDELYRKRMSE